jgi:hypothetical protein
MNTANRRVSTLGGHFNVEQHLPQQVAGSGGIMFDTSELQRLLEHDNWETRRQMKELMKADVFIP